MNKKYITTALLATSLFVLPKIALTQENKEMNYTPVYATETSRIPPATSTNHNFTYFKDRGLPEKVDSKKTTYYKDDSENVKNIDRLSVSKPKISEKSKKFSIIPKFYRYPIEFAVREYGCKHSNDPNCEAVLQGILYSMLDTESMGNANFKWPAEKKNWPQSPNGKFHGPFQFGKAAWKEVGMDCDGDGVANRYSLADSACAAVRYIAPDFNKLGTIDEKISRALKKFNPLPKYWSKIKKKYNRLLGMEKNQKPITTVVEKKSEKVEFIKYENTKDELLATEK
jgi:hypothetical protein